jgi:PAS domain S-box-containing protein
MREARVCLLIPPWLPEAGLASISAGSAPLRSGDFSPEAVRLAEEVEALRAREAGYREVVESVREVIFRTDAEGRWRYLNPSWPRITGHPLAASLGVVYLDFVHPDDRRGSLERFARLVSGEGEVASHEVRYLTRDGGFRWMEVLAQAIRRPDGTFTGTSGTLSDVHQRRLAEEQFHGSEDRFRALSRILEDVIWDWDPRTGSVAWNGAGREQLLGHPVERIGDFLGWWTEHIHPDDRPRVMERLDRALGGTEARWQDQYRFRKGDGTWAIVLHRGIIIRDGAGTATRAIGSSLDITERVRADDEIRFQAGVLAAAPHAVVATDLDGRVTYANPAAEALFGHRFSEASGRSIFSLIHLADESAARHFAAHVTSGRAWGGEYWLRDLHGTRRLINAFGYPLRGRDGALTGTVALAADVTDRHRLEEQLRESQNLEAVGRLAGGVAHEFNNLLTAIASYADLLGDGLAPEGQQRSDLDGIRAAAGEAASLTHQLLAFSRRQLLRPRDVDVNDVLLGLEPLLRTSLPPAIRLVLEPAATIGPVRVDPGQLRHVVLNLALNARDAMPAGGTVTIRTRQVDGSAAGSGDGSPGPGRWIALSVNDTGSGIPAEHLPHLFEPFFTTRDAATGAGLGLAMVYGTVRQSGGRLQVLSAAGEGTTFIIYLPEAEPDARSTLGAVVAEADVPDPVVPAPATPAPAAPVPNARVLVVDDEAHLRGVVRRALEREGYQVVTAANGAEALDRWVAEGPMDLVLSDVVMPELGGLDLIRALRERGEDPRVLLVSGYTEEETFRDREVPPGLPFLEKPFTLQALCSAVSESLAKPRPAA